jgi:hypothetical protein
MSQLDTVAAVANAHAIDDKNKIIKQLRFDRNTARLTEMAMQGRRSPQERHTAALQVRALDRQIESAVIELGALEKSMAAHITTAYADIESQRHIDAAVAQARSQPAAPTRPRAPAGASTGLSAIYAALNPQWNE